MKDWKKWESDAKIPIYDPHGLRPGYLETCYCVNWYGLRSPIGLTFSNCCLDLMCANMVKLDDMENFKPLMNSVNPNCPSEYVGIYWLRDLTQPTSLITLHDADWKSDRLGYKSFRTNWVKANTCAGSASTLAFLIGNKIGASLKFEISPNRKWMLFSYPINLCGYEFTCGPKQWIYVFVNGGSMYLSNGNRIDIEKGDMLRLDFETWNDPTSEITYMYLIHRVYTDEDLTSSNRLKATAELKSRSQVEGAEPFCMNCDNSKNSIIPHLSNHQHILRIAPQVIERN